MTQIVEKRTQQALHADLARYLIGIGESLVYDGHAYRHCLFQSLSIYKNSYSWKELADTGHSVDFLTKYMHTDYEGAVLELTRTELENYD
jgi:hypothetical protein